MSLALANPVSAQAVIDTAAHHAASGTATTLTDATLSASTSNGGRAWGVLAQKSGTGAGSTLTVTDTTITTSGAKAHGVQSGAKGGSADGSDASKIILGQNVSVTTSGNDSFGLHAIDGSTIEGAASITTSGVNGFGAFAESYSAINLTGGSITTTGQYAYGLIANNDRNDVAGVITATDVAIATSADWTFGAVAQGGASITLTGGSIKTTGLRGYGLLAEDASTITSSAAITTTGVKAHGAQTSSSAGSNGGTIHFTGGSISTSGSDAFGLHAVGKGKIDGTVAISTTGVNGFGAFAETNSAITLTGGTITTTGANAFGLIGNNDNNGVGGIVSVTDTVVTTSGAGAHGALVAAGGTVKAKGGSITATGDDAAAVAIIGTGTITLDGVTLASTDGPTALVNLGTANDVATLTFGAGTVATQNNGTLVQVNRTGLGENALFKLTLAAGSNTKGDIIDTVGGTQLTIETGAKHDGKITGVQDLVAQAGSTLNIAAGSQIVGDLTGDGAQLAFAPGGATIGGDLILTNGAVTSGGSLIPTSQVVAFPTSIRPSLRNLLVPGATPIIVFGDVSVDPSSRLGGNWVIGGNFHATGMLRPGNSIGLVVVGGDVSLGSASLYDVEIDGKGGSDRIAAGGVATLEGGAVKVSALDKTQSYKQAQTYTILSAEGGVEGKFGSVSTDSIFLKTVLGYSKNAVDLTVSIPTDAFQSVAATDNQFAAATALDSLTQSGSSLALYNTIAFQTSVAQARSAFEQLAGDSYASVKTGLIESAHLTTDAITARLRDDVNADGEAKSAVWVSGFGSWIDHNANGNAGNLKTSTGGVLAGADLDLGGVRLGLAAGYSQSDLKMKRRAATADSNNWHLGIYAGKKWNALGLRAGLTHTWHSIDLSRSVAFAGFSNDLDSDFKAKTLQAFGELNYSLALGSAALEPFANLSHVRLHTNSFKEEGGLAALNVKSGNTNTTFTTLGMRGSAPLSTAAKLRGGLGWRHAFGDITPESAQYFTGSKVFTVDGVAIAKNAVLLEAGVDIDLSQAATFGVSYVGQFGDGTSQNGVNARLKFAF